MDHTVHVESQKWSLTSEYFLPHFERVHDRCDDPFNGSKHAAKPEIYQHEEKHHWPEGRCREMSHGFCKGNESQSSALHSLQNIDKSDNLKVGKSLSNSQSYCKEIC